MNENQGRTRWHGPPARESQGRLGPDDIWGAPAAEKAPRTDYDRRAAVSPTPQPILKRLRIFDPAAFILAVAATFLGLVFVFDAGYARSLAQERGAIPREFLWQIVFCAAALGTGVVASRIKAGVWEGLARPLWVLSLLALALTVVPGIGYEMNGAHRWIKLGPLTVQPAELAKVALVLYLASVFARRKAWPAKPRLSQSFALKIDNVWIPKLKRAMPAVWVFGAVILIEMEPDLGTGFILFATAFVMFWIGGVTKRSLAWLAAICLAGCVFLVYEQPYRLDRITNHFTRWQAGNLDDVSYQTVQSEYAMASGGVIGVGMGAGRAKHVMPAATTDFITATVAEEFGLLGWLAVVGVLGALSWRLCVLAVRAQSRFAALVLGGVGAWIGLQSIGNAMMANGTLPAIGIPLPFISSGGSSLIALWIAMGICQSMLAPQAASTGNKIPLAKPMGYAA